MRVTGGVQITNNTSSGLADVVVNASWLGLLDQCADPGPACVRLKPGGVVVVPDAEIHGLSSETTRVEVRWWRVVPDGQGGYTVDEAHAKTIKL